MKWVAWRQSRMELIIGVVFLAALAVILVPMGLHSLSLFKSLGLATMSPNDASYATLSQQFLETYPQWINDVVNLTGALIFIFGALLAVPIVLEFEQRTYRLSWTQSITRRRWLLTKLGFALAAAVIISALCSVLLNWFLGPTNILTGMFNNFSEQGIVPVAYFVLGFAVALAAGILIRRSSAGVIVAVVVCFAASTVAPLLGHGLPLNYLTPLQQVSAFNPPAPSSGQAITVRIGGDLPFGSRVVDHYFIDTSGNSVALPQVINSAPGSIRQVTEYQPADRFWAFQWLESAIFFVASIVLLFVSSWVIEHRLR